MLHQLDDVVLRRDIQSSRRLVEQQYIWLLGQRSGDEDPLLLSSGEVAQRAVSMPLHPHVSQGVQRDLAIFP